MKYFDLLRSKFIETYKHVRQDEDYYYLYKHIRFDNDLKIFGIFQNNKFLYTKPTSFNDPYDCLCKIEYDFSKISKSDLEEIVGKQMSHKYFKERGHIYIRKFKELPEIKNWGDIGRDSFYVTCFNNSPLNILMWSHYTDHHKGFMLELKFKKNKDIYNNLPMPVFYNDEYPILKYPYNLTAKDCMDNPEYGSELLIKRLLNKSTVWSYENEFRVVNRGNISGDKDSELLEFDPSSLTSVILGTKIDQIHRKKLEIEINKFNKQHGLNVEIFESRLSETEYKIEVKDHPRLKKASI